MKIGLFGGTLDPIHLGHLRVAEEVWEAVGLDEIWFLPAYLPPHKLHKSLTPFEKRLKMVEIAIKGNPHFKLSSIEKQRKGVSYSVDLLKELNLKYLEVGYRFFFIIGSDAFMELDQWKEYENLPKLATLIVLKRPPHSIFDIENKALTIFPKYKLIIDDFRKGKDLKDTIFVFSPTALDISATKIRDLVKEDKSIKYLVTEEVRKYIMMERLYKPVEEPEFQRPTNSKEAAQEIYNAILDNKGEKIVVLDMRGISPIADFFMISQGRSTKHVQGMANKMRRELSKKGIKCKSVEGEEEGKWILMDFDDVVVHLFYEPIRKFYDLEGLWIEAPRLILANGRLVKETDHEKQKN